MMKKIILSLLLLFPVFALTVSAQSEKEIFDATIKHVDTGGTLLNYLNTSQVAEGIKEFASLLEDTIIENYSQGQIDGEVKSVMQIILNLLKLEAYKGYAVSEKTAMENGKKIYTLKSYLYTADSPRGIAFDFFPSENQSFATMSMIPENTILASGGFFTPDKVWETLKAEFAKSEQLNIKQAPEMLSAILMAGMKINLPALLESLDGEYLLLVTLTEDEDFPKPQIMLVLPDQNGYLTQFIKNQMKSLPLFTQTSEGVYALSSPPPSMPEWMAPHIIFEEKSVILVSHPDISFEASEAKEKGGLMKSATLAPHLNGMPDKGISYVYLKIDKTHIDYALSKIPADLSAIFSSMDLKFIEQPIFLYGVNFVDESGSGGHFKSTFSPQQLQFIAPSAILAGTLMPALGTAREKARQINCINHLKQSALLMFLYDADNNEFPPQKGWYNIIQGKGYWTDKSIFKCPASSEEIGYYYVGNINPKDNPGDIPLFFDKPGNHKNGVVNVAFQDGHVEAIYVYDYMEPADVIYELNEIYDYPEEVFTKLLNACDGME